MKVTNFLMSAVMFAALATFGCGSDSGGTAGSGNGGGEACNVGDCATSDALMAACLDIYEDCLDVGEQSEAQCRDLAESANCRLTP